MCIRIFTKARWTASGSAVVFALIITSAVAVLFTSILIFITAQIRNASYAVGGEQAFQIAESGINYYKWYLAHGTDGRTAQQVQAFWGAAEGVGTPYEIEYSDPSGGPVGRYRIEVSPPDPGSTIAWITSTGWTYKFPNQKRVVRVRFRRPSWSESAVLGNAFIRFGDGTEVHGKIFSNQGIRFDGLAHNVVSSAVASVVDPDHGGGSEFGVHTHANPPPASGVNDTFRTTEAPPRVVPTRTDVFEAGRVFPVTTVDFNGVIGDLGLMKTQAQGGGGVYFDNSNYGRRIILKTNGTFDICKVKSYDSATGVIANNSGYAQNTGNGSCSSCGSNNCTQNYTIPQNGVIFVEDNIWLSGQVSGKKVTVVSANLTGSGSNPSVFIPNDIRYTNYNGSDIIGVIGQQDVEIPLDSESDLRIDAALIAQQGRVGRANYGMSDHKNVITVFGAIATNQRYGFAWTNGSLDWGYTTRNLYYDNNLMYYPPPYFPTGTQYFVDLWEEQ